jgi:bifunctional DNase/RNase
MALHETTDREVRIRGLGPVAGDACVVVLEEVGGARLLPIFTALADGEAMARQLAGVEPPRPLTHELIVNIARAFGWSAARVVISDVKEGTFHARIDFEREGLERSVDARPSDAVNIALRARCPIFVAERVFAESDSVLKPIGDEEKKQFVQDLDRLDLDKVFQELAEKPAPREPGLSS